MTGARGMAAVGRGMAWRQVASDQAGWSGARPEPVPAAAALSLAVLVMALMLAALVAWQLLVDPQAFVDRLAAGDNGWAALLRGLVGR